MKKIAIFGLGYVGLPLAIEFGKKIPTIGFDIDKNRIDDLNNHQDKTLEIDKDDFLMAQNLIFTDKVNEIKDCNFYIITVPTPIDESQKPDLNALIEASKMVGSIICKGDIIIYESTVYPGCTEDECVPVLEESSNLIFNIDFFVGYSPERVNPGDGSRKLADIVKVTSGSTEEASNTIDILYNEIIDAGTHKAPNIRVAEASKVAENIQRDVNIALINELAIIFNHLEIDTQEVLKAATTKWNFLPFTPGLVGGHCIGIDPYYLKYKAQSIGYNPEIISAVRNLNDSMGFYIVERLIQAMNIKKIKVEGSNILIMGFTFKENCPDIRNTRVIDVINSLKAYNVNVSIFDPWVSKVEAKSELNVDLINEPKLNNYDAILIAVAHDLFKDIGTNGIKSFGKKTRVIYDLKYLLPLNQSDVRL